MVRSLVVAEDRLVFWLLTDRERASRIVEVILVVDRSAPLGLAVGGGKDADLPRGRVVGCGGDGGRDKTLGLIWESERWRGASPLSISLERMALGDKQRREADVI
jgi:hypothetical protein